MRKEGKKGEEGKKEGKKREERGREATHGSPHHKQAYDTLPRLCFLLIPPRRDAYLGLSRRGLLPQRLVNKPRRL